MGQMRLWMGRLGIATVVLAPLPVIAQGASRPSQPVTEAVRVNVVNVEVYVTDSRGQPVLGLAPEEFELYEDGRLVRLTNFLPPPKRPPTGAVAPTPSPEAAPPAEEEQRRTLVVFVDDLNLGLGGRKRVLDRLGPFLDERLRDGYRVVLLAFGRSLRRLTPLTADASTITAALAGLKHHAPEGAMVRAERSRILRDMGRPVAQEGGEMGQLAREAIHDDIRSGALEQTVLERSLLASLTGLVDSLSGVPGRKAILFVSDGVPREANADLMGEFDERFASGEAASGVAPEEPLTSRLRDVARRANASRTTFYTINGGSEAGFGSSAEEMALNATPIEAADEVNRDASLSTLTTETGGRKLLNPEALQTMAMDLESFYSLGYSPGHFGDGRYHRLSVKVARTGVSVRFREGYLDKTPEQRQKDVTAAALFAGGNSNPLGARLELGVPEMQGHKKVAVPLTVFVPATSLVLLPVADSHEGTVSIAIAVAGKDGRTSEVHRETFPIKVPSAHIGAFLRQTTSFTFTLVAAPTDAAVSVTVRDETASVESVVVTPLPDVAAKR